MFAYYLRLALLSLRRNRILTALMVAAIALGIGAAMTSLTVLHLMSGNPLAHKDEQVRRVQLDNWSPGSPYSDRYPDEPPNLMTYRDVVALMEADRADRHAALYPVNFPIEPARADLPPFPASVLATTGDFFPMFEPPFRFGNGWGAQEDEAAARVVVLSAEINDRLFGGEDSTGRTVRMDGEDFTVVGVLEPWNPAPRTYHIAGGAFSDPEDVYVPFKVGIEKELTSASNNNCWQNTEPGYQAWLQSECVWLDLWVEVEDQAAADAYLSFLDDYVREQKTLGRFERPLNNRLRSVSEFLASQNVVSRDARTQVWLSFAFLLVCLVNTVGLLLAKFLGKAPEIGLRRAVGASKPQIFTQYLTESAIVGVLGGLFGILLSWGGLAALRALYEGTATEQLARMDWAMVAVTVLIALAASLLAGLYPTWRACQITPATQLKTQ
jgi:putative ABC transport system permease protein